MPIYVCMLLVPPSVAAGPNVVLLCFPFLFALDPPLFSFFIAWSFSPLSCCPFITKGVRSLTACVRGWVDDEPALLVSYCLTRLSRGWGTVDEHRTETADRGTRYQTDYEHVVGRTWLYATLVPQTAAPNWRVFRASVCFCLPVISLGSDSCSVRGI